MSPLTWAIIGLHAVLWSAIIHYDRHVYDRFDVKTCGSFYPGTLTRPCFPKDGCFLIRGHEQQIAGMCWRKATL